MPSPVTLERMLPNGLKVILRESHEAPIGSFWVWYRVGGRNEQPGLTGVSHWVEHMQFKGTPTRAKGAIFAEVSRNGGVANALTANDWTGYFATLPIDRIDLALAIESDRMTNSLFDPEETESERTVILSERQGAENSPVFLLYEEVVGAAFHAHPYRHMVVGYETDLRAISRDDLYHHYRRAYCPANAFVTAVGDFDAEELCGRIEQAFGDIAPGASLPPLRAAEPEQRGERRVTLRRPSPTAYLRLGFKAPPANHPDTPALLVADAVLSGAKQMGLGGGTPMGRSARLYRALVAAGFARAAGSDFDLFIDPYLLMIGVTALPGVDPERIERIVDAEIERLRTDPLPEDELRRAMKQVSAQYIYSAEGVTNQAFWLGQMEVVGDHRRADRLVEELQAVTVADVQRVAATYLTPERRTTGWLLPDRVGGGSRDESSAIAPYRRWGIGGGEGTRSVEKTSRPPFERAELADGLIVLGQVQRGDPAISLKIRVEAGAALDPPDRAGLAAFTARMLIRGTVTRSFEAINELTDGLGATLSVDPGRSFVELGAKCLREDLPTVVELVADLLRAPSFPADEVDKVRNELIAAVKEQENDTRAVADQALRDLIYPDGHPLRHRVIGHTSSLLAIDGADLVAHHRRSYGPRVTTCAIVGGVESFRDAVELIETHFGDWSATVATPAPPAAPPPPHAEQRSTVAVPGKSQADIGIGFPTIPRSDPAYYALEMANLILGRLGLMGRLGANVRDRQGLAYYAYSAVETGRTASLWVARAGVDPTNIERAISGVIDEVRRIRAEPVTVDELADSKSFLTGSLPIALETNGGVASTLLNIEYHGLGLDYLDRYPLIINGLTAEELMEAAREHLDPARLAVSVAAPG